MHSSYEREDFRKAEMFVQAEIPQLTWFKEPATGAVKSNEFPIRNSGNPGVNDSWTRLRKTLVMAALNIVQISFLSIFLLDSLYKLQFTLFQGTIAMDLKSQLYNKPWNWNIDSAVTERQKWHNFICKENTLKLIHRMARILRTIC